MHNLYNEGTLKAIVLFLSPQLENIQVFQVTGTLGDDKEEEKAANAQVTAAMQHRLGLAVRVALKEDNCIKQVNADPEDDEWSLNIKRALANLFQIAPRQDDQECDRNRDFVTQMEVRNSLKYNFIGGESQTLHSS